MGGAIGGVAVFALILGITLGLKRKKPHNLQSHQIPWIQVKGEDCHEPHEIPGDDGSKELDAVRPIPELASPKLCHEVP